MASRHRSPQSRFDNRRVDLLDAAAAARALGVKPATLYTYVSRGFLVSVPVPGSRKHYYALADILRLKTRHDAPSTSVHCRNAL
jgi:citrate synthase